MRNQTFSMLLAIAACGGGAGAPGVDAAPPTDGTPTADASDIPMIGDALAAQCGAYTPASGVGAGDDLHKVTLTSPEAVCNDGTPAVMYVRPSTGGVNADRWVIYLQGGSGCGQFGDCTIRYCGTQKYTKAKMSSRWTPMAANTDSQGLFDRDGINPFGEANAVLLYYCSSDNWSGTHSDAVLTNPLDTSQRYRVHFRGHSIVAAAIDQLLAGARSDDGVVTMPSLSTAGLVVWSGTSAGAAGAENHADYVAGRLAANGTTVRAVFDANLPPDARDLDPAIADATTAQLRDSRWPEVMQTNWGIFADQSCLAAHQPADQWQCGDQNHVVMNHITTPFIARQDLRDSVIGGRYLDAGATLPELAGWWRTSLQRVPELLSTAEERAQMTIAPGIYGPNCNQHVALTNRDYFQVSTVTPAAGQPLTWRGAIVQWLTGNAVVLIDTQPATLSSCPPPVDNGE